MPYGVKGGRSFVKPLLDKNRALPRMTWGPENLYNLWQRTLGPLERETNFTRTPKTLFQQRWISKRLARAYHGDHIGDTKFQRWYLPESIPVVHSSTTRSSAGPNSRDIGAWVAGRARGGGRGEEENRRAGQEKDGRAPVGTLMFREVERRVDVLVFRACFARSVWQARQMVVHKKVKVNGEVMNNPNVRLNPGDLFSVDPTAMPMLQLPPITPPTEEPTTPESSETLDDSPDSPSAPPTPAPKPTKTPAPRPKAAFTLPPYSAPFLFIPAYLEVSFKTCAAVYVRHPTARAGYSEIPSPYDADGAVMAGNWEWFKRRAPNMSSRRDRWMSPERQTDRK